MYHHHQYQPCHHQLSYGLLSSSPIRQTITKDTTHTHTGHFTKIIEFQELTEYKRNQTHEKIEQQNN